MGSPQDSGGRRPRVAVVGDYEGVFERSEHVRGLRERADVRVFGEPVSAAQAARELQGFEVLIAMRERTPFPAALLEQLGALELISQSGGHAYHVDLDAAARLGVLVAVGRPPGSGGPRPSVMPELVFGLLFGLLRELPTLHAAMARGDWPASLGRAARGRTLGVLGMGRHGTAVARAAQAFGMEAVAWGPTLTDDRARAADVARLELDELLGRVDVLSIHLRLSDESRGLIDARRLALMRAGALLINTARGAIVDEPALVEALAAGRLAGAGLDVYTDEPLAADSPLRTLPNVLLTPHVGWTVDRVIEEFVEDTTTHVQRYLDGRLDADALANPEALTADRTRCGGVAA
jgi:phosphoglycerate dehydrogenase-like enzyme